MSFQRYDISLYDIANLPDWIRKDRELKRWRDIMAQMKYEQDDLPGYLDAEAQARESDISEEAKVRRQNALAMRWFGYYKKCQDPKKKIELAKQYNLVATMRQR